MGSEQIHIVDPPFSFIIKLWLLALVGLVGPSLAVRYWPDFSWVGKTERALKNSLENREWEDPWVPINQKEFSSGWVRCSSLEDAIRLDQRVDDGQPHTGRLVLSEGGIAWRGR